MNFRFSILPSLVSCFMVLYVCFRSKCFYCCRACFLTVIFITTEIWRHPQKVVRQICDLRLTPLQQEPHKRKLLFAWKHKSDWHHLSTAARGAVKSLVWIWIIWVTGVTERGSHFRTRIILWTIDIWFASIPGLCSRMFPEKFRILSATVGLREDCPS